MEGWHNRWGDLIREKHVGIIRFVHALKEEQKYCNRKIIDIERRNYLGLEQKTKAKEMLVV